MTMWLLTKVASRAVSLSISSSSSNRCVLKETTRAVSIVFFHPLQNTPQPTTTKSSSDGRRWFSSSRRALHRVDSSASSSTSSSADALLEVVLLGIPSDVNSSFLRGSALAPPLICQALHSDATNSWSESPSMDILQDPNFIVDGGDITIDASLSSITPASHFEQIQTKVSEVLLSGPTTSNKKKTRRILSLGGDHSITYPILTTEAFAQHHGIRPKHPLTILHLDAHPDLYHNFQDNPYSHASPFARLLEASLENNNNNNNKNNSDDDTSCLVIGRLIQVGIRTMNDHQREQANKFGMVEVVTMATLEERHFDATLAAIKGIKGPLYLSLDVDVLDPAFAPGVSHPEPGGLSVRQVLQMIQAVRAPLIGADVIEYNPDCDVQGMTACVAAKLVKEIAAKMLTT